MYASLLHRKDRFRGPQPVLRWTLTVSLLGGCLLDPVAAQPSSDLAGKIVAVQGRVEIQQGAAWVPVQVDQELSQGAVIRTGERSRAVILLTDETMHKLHAETVFQLKSVRQASGWFPTAAGVVDTLLTLFQGRSWIRSKKRPVQLTVETPAVTAAIRGTEVDLRVTENLESIVTVLEGVVDMDNPQGSLRLNPGEQGRARPGEAPSKTVLVNPRDAVQWTLFYTASVSPRDYPFRFASAEDALQALQTASADPVARARLLHDAGRLAEAFEQLRDVPGPEAAQIRGWVLLAQNYLPEASAELRQAGADSPRARVGLSLVHFRLGDSEEAYRLVEPPGSEGIVRVHKSFLDLLTGDVESARTLLESVSRDDPYYALAQGLLSNVLIVQNQGQEALAAAQRAVAARPESPSAHLSLSRILQSRFELSAARRSAEQALKLDPNFLQARLQVAELQFGQGRTGRAERLVQEALAIAPKEARVHSLLGFLFLARGKTSRARQAFDEALRLDSTLSRSRLGLGLVEMRQGRAIEAGRRIMEAATIDPQVSLYQSYLAKAFYEQQEFEQAFSALDSATELDPLDPTPHLYSGIFRNDLNRPGLAVQDFRDSIRLNDNRAVYRSRFLLDQDRATRNVQLATAYRRLGLSEWANLEAVRSSVDDPSNSSSHLFLADTFLNLKGRTLAAGSELLWARLLMPANANSFNSFNDFTTLFERPRLDLTAEGAYGSFDTVRGTAIASGGASRYAFRSDFTYDRSSGFRPEPENDHEKAYTGFAILKFAPTAHSDFFVSYGHQQTNQGDPGFSPLVNDQTDPSLNVFSRIDRAEIGYRHRFRPGSELVAVFSGREEGLVFNDTDFPLPHARKNAMRLSQRRPNLNLQLAHLFRLEKVQLKYGFDILEGRTRTRILWDFINHLGKRQVQEFQVTRQKNRFKAAFAQADFELTPRLTVTGGLNYDWSNDDNVFDDKQRSTSHWSPQGGVLFNPWDRTNFRFAAARILQTHVQETLAPAHINGFALNRNEEALTESTAFDWGWDQSWTPGSFMRVTAFYRDNVTPYALWVRPQYQYYDFEGNFYGGDVVWSQFFTEKLTFVAGYSLEHNEGLSALRHDHEATWRLFFVHPSGFSARVEENYFNQHGRLRLPDLRLGFARIETGVWTTGAAFSYEFPNKRALLAFQVSNLFDRRYEFLANPLDLDPRIPRRQMELLLRVNF